MVSGTEHTYCSADPPFKVRGDAHTHAYTHTNTHTYTRIHTYTHTASATDACVDYGAACPLVPALLFPAQTFLFFIAANITYNQCMLYVFKTGSSVLFVIASACRLPLVDLFCMSHALAGRAQQEFTVYDGFALFILVLAIYIYYSEPELQADPAVEDDPAPSPTGDIAMHTSKDRTASNAERTPMLVSPHVGRHMYSGPQPHDGSVYQLLDGSQGGRRMRSASVNV